MQQRPFYKIYLDKRPLYFLALLFFTIYGPVTYIFYIHIIQKGALLEEFTKEPVTWALLLLVHIFVFALYGGFIRQIFIDQPTIELYDDKIRIYPVFGFKIKDIPISKVIKINYLENTLLQKGCFNVCIATKNKVKSRWHDTKTMHATLAKFKNPDNEVQYNLKKYEERIKQNQEKFL